MSSRELCRVGADGGFACAQFLPQDDYGLVGAPPLTFSPVEGLDDVSEVALAGEAGCARRRSGEVLCWGPMFRHGGVVRRDAPVDVGGFDAAERLAAVDSYLCALQRGVVSCWGGGRFRRGTVVRPRALRGVTDATGLASAWDMLCVTRAQGGVGCWVGDPFESSLWMVRGAPPGAFHALVGAGRSLYALDDRSRAWVLLDTEDRATFSFRRAASLDGYKHIVVGSELTCGLRTGELMCPQDGDPSGVNEWRAPGFAAARASMLPLVPRLEAVPGEVLWSGVPREIDLGERRSVEEMAVRALLPEGVRATGTGGTNLCLLGVSGRVACQWLNDSSYAMLASYCAGVSRRFAPMLVPGLRDAVELEANGGLTCARRAAGAVVCWGANHVGVLTAAEEERAPTLHRLDAMVASELAR